MRWTLAGAAYVAVYLLMMLVLANHPEARVWAGNIGLLIPPLFPIAIVVARRDAWSGRALVFWSAVSAGPGGWRAVYRRCAGGVGLGALLVVPNGLAMAAGSYATGAFADIGWIVPFFFYGYAAREAPASVAETPTAVDQWQAPAES